MSVARALCTYKHCGTLPRTKGIAPWTRRAFTRSPSSSLGPRAALDAIPHVESCEGGRPGDNKNIVQYIICHVMTDLTLFELNSNFYTEFSIENLYRALKGLR